MLLCAAVVATFVPVGDVFFVNLDDSAYLLTPHIKGGVTCANLLWATSSLEIYWQPATWISHMVAWDIWSSNARGHRFTNVVFQALAVAALCGWLKRWFGPSSIVVAGLWALHPLRVESVAWISERKDILSGLFGFSTLILWERYKEAPSRQGYALVVLTFGLALMSKPTVVALPLALFLSDLWPARRNLACRKLIIEKAPLFALSLGVSCLTIIGQRDTGHFNSCKFLSPFGCKMLSCRPPVI